MLTINKYNKETLDRSSISITYRYKGIVTEKVTDINNVKALTMMLYKTIYYYLDDARITLEQLAEIVESWGKETGIDTTSIIDEIKHTEDMVKVVEKITDDNYGSDSGDSGDNEEEEERKIYDVTKETEKVVEVVKENPKLKEEVKEEVKEEAKTELPTSTPTTPSAPVTPPTPEEAKSDARQDAADSIRSRGKEGGITYITEVPTNPIERVASGVLGVVVDIITKTKTGEPATKEATTNTTREAGLDAAATIIERGGTAEEAVGAYVDAVTLGGQVGRDEPGSYLGYDDESRETINDDIQAIIDAVNEAAAAESESNNPGSETPGSTTPGASGPTDSPETPTTPTGCGSDECPSDAYCDCTSDITPCSSDCNSDCPEDCEDDICADCSCDDCTSDTPPCASDTPPCGSDCPSDVCATDGCDCASDCGIDIPCDSDICVQD